MREDDRTDTPGGGPPDSLTEPLGDLMEEGLAPLPRPGATFADYEILEEIGEGGMGVVYRARHRVLGRIVALKFLQPHLGATPEEVVERFLREARSLAELEHHNVVNVYHVGQHDGLRFIEMQYVEGESVARRLERGALDVEEAVQIAEQVAHALEHAHRHGVVHRDIKPANVLITPEGLVKVVDFGLARPVRLDTSITTSGVLLGTPPYMAPEQWRGGPVDTRSDLYALGGMLFEMVAGRPPFFGEFHELLEQHLHAPPPRLSELRSGVPLRLERVVERLLAKSPGERYQEPGLLVRDLRRLGNSAHEDLARLSSERADRPSPSFEGAPPRSRRTRSSLTFSLLAAAVVSLLVFGVARLGWLERLELLCLDLRYARTSGAPGPSPVVVVLIDQASKDRLAGGRALSRAAHHAELIGRLADAGASAIAVDLLFTEQSTSGEDGPLKAMTALAENVVHALNLPVPSAHSGKADVGALRGKWALEVPTGRLPVAGRLDAPYPELSRATSRAGHVSLTVDADGVCRRVPHLIVHRGEVYPSLSLATVLAVVGAARDDVRRRSEAIEVARSDGGVLRIPVDPRAQMLLNFRWDQAGIKALSLAQVLEDLDEETLRNEVADRVVVIGSRLEGDSDVGSLSGRRLSPLVWAHAVAIDTMLRSTHVVSVGPVWTLFLVAAMAFTACVAAGWLRVRVGLPVVLVASVVYVAAVLWAFRGETRVALPAAAPLLSLASGFAVAGAGRLWRGEREKWMLERMLGRYLSPAVASRVLSDPGAFELGGQRREITLLSVELHDFDKVCERLEPEEVNEFLGRFFDELTQVVFEHAGTVDTYSGHGLRAFFGDPEPQEDHPLRGVRCALRIRERLERLSRDWSAADRPRVRTGIGVHSGYVTVGNIGSRWRTEYTAIGRNVEAVERLARRASGQILVSARTRALTEREVVYQIEGEGEGECFEALRERRAA